MQTVKAEEIEKKHGHSHSRLLFISSYSMYGCMAVCLYACNEMQKPATHWRHAEKINENKINKLAAETKQINCSVASRARISTRRPWSKQNIIICISLGKNRAHNEISLCVVCSFCYFRVIYMKRKMLRYTTMAEQFAAIFLSLSPYHSQFAIFAFYLTELFACRTLYYMSCTIHESVSHLY